MTVIFFEIRRGFAMSKRQCISLLVCLGMVLPLTACGNFGVAADSTAQISSRDESVESSAAEQSLLDHDATEAEASDDLDADMEKLEAIGDVEVENGILTVSITLPADLVGEDVTQKSLDEKVGEKYVAVMLNEDGSVTYKMTKAQHEQMLAELKKTMEDAFEEMIESDTYNITAISYNDNCSVFEVTLGSDALGFADSFSVLSFYLFGGMYGIFSGDKSESIIVNFYDPDGNLIETADSADMGEQED